MANLLELAEENRFRIRAYTNAAQTISDMTADIEAMMKQDKLTELSGIGQGIADKIKEYCTTGKVAEYEKIKSKYPSGLLKIHL